MEKALINRSLNFNFNPFGGVGEEDLVKVIVPHFDLRQVVEAIQSGESIVIELVGQKGRGKTLHLNILQKALKQYPLFSLNGKIALKKIV